MWMWSKSSITQQHSNKLSSKVQEVMTWRASMARMSRLHSMQQPQHCLSDLVVQAGANNVHVDDCSDLPALERDS